VSKVVLTGYIIVPDADLFAVKNELPNHIKLTTAEQGCLRFEVSLDQTSSNRFNVYEEFVDKKSFEQHQLRVKNSDWGRVTVNVERYYQIDGAD